MNNGNQPKALIVRHENDSVKELSACGHRYRLLSKEDQGIAAWAHAVEIDGAKPHYHKKTTELYYVLEGKGYVTLNDKEEVVQKGSIIHIPPGVIHGAKGKMKVLVIGIPDIDDSDIYYPR